MYVKEFLIQQRLRLLAESFIRDRSRNTATYDMKLFATVVQGFNIWIWMLINWPLFIRFQCFAVVQFFFFFFFFFFFYISIYFQFTSRKIHFTKKQANKVTQSPDTNIPESTWQYKITNNNNIYT